MAMETLGNDQIILAILWVHFPNLTPNVFLGCVLMNNPAEKLPVNMKQESRSALYPQCQNKYQAFSAHVLESLQFFMFIKN
jgi:hypothetical protein